MNCEVCEKTFSGIINYKQHQASKKHLNKLKLAEALSSRSQMGSGDKSLINCSVCKVTFYEIHAFQKHAESLEHAKMVTKVKDNVVAKADEKTPEKTIQEKTEETIEKVLPSVFALSDFKCELCNKRFSGLKPYQQHLDSANHKRKSIKLEETANLSLKPTILCEICSKQFNGSVPYLHHLESSAHKKKESELHGTSKSSKLSEPDFKWYCKICNKQCNGSIPYEQHMSSKVHFKNLKSTEGNVNPKTTQELTNLKQVKGNPETLSSIESISDKNIEFQKSDSVFETGFIPTPMSLDISCFGEDEETDLELPLQKKIKLFHNESDMSDSNVMKNSKSEHNLELEQEGSKESSDDHSLECFLPSSSEELPIGSSDALPVGNLEVSEESSDEVPGISSDSS